MNDRDVQKGTDSDGRIGLLADLDRARSAGAGFDLELDRYLFHVREQIDHSNVAGDIMEPLAQARENMDAARKLAAVTRQAACVAAMLAVYDAKVGTPHTKKTAAIAAGQTVSVTFKGEPATYSARQCRRLLAAALALRCGHL